MSGYHPSLAFSAHTPQSPTQQRKSQTPKKFTKIPVIPNRIPLPKTEQPYQSRTPQKFSSPYKEQFNRTHFKPMLPIKEDQDTSSKLFKSNHIAAPKYNPENGVNMVQKEKLNTLLPPKAGKQRKRSQNNITFENKLVKNASKKEENTITTMTASTSSKNMMISSKERRGSCNNLWLNNLSQKKQKIPRVSMVDHAQMGEKKVKKMQRGWDQNNQFSMEETAIQEQNSYSPISKEIKKETPNKRKYSDNSCVKKPPSFLTSPKGLQEYRGFTAPIRPKMSIERFKILKQLGKGAYGKVVLAVEKESKFVCAIKILSKQDIKEENMVEQFIREIKTQCFFNHPNIVKVYGYFDDPLHLYIVMECALDQRLSDILKQRQLIESEASTVFYQLCSAVSQLHVESVIHRDLKPQNVMLHEGVVKVCDFGWSVFRGSQLRTTFCGTPLYLSPEILVGQSYDESVDVWALGIILYQMMLGSGPFKITCSEELVKILHENVDLQDKNLSIELKAIIQACLSKTTDKRPSVKWLITREWSQKGRPDQCKRLSNKNDF